MNDSNGTVLIPLDDCECSKPRIKAEAIQLAALRTKASHRKFVVREGAHDTMFFVVPLFKEGHEGQQHDPRFNDLGPIVEESFDG